MATNILTLAKLKSHIKRRLKQNRRLDLLGLVENRDLTPEVESMFTFYGIGMNGYDWVNGNDKLRDLINVIKTEIIK